jgi:ribonuclease BN (tRNA processing enzyme)
MKVSIEGVRGSVPTTKSETSGFGGNTSCVTISENGYMLILDGGTGIQNVKLPEQPPERVDILLTHLHLDHIQGLGFFGPLFETTQNVHIWAPSGASNNLRARLNRYLSPPLFPIHFRDIPCDITLHEISNSIFEIGPFEILSQYVIHPGPTVGFRVKGKNAVMAYIPDHEPALGPKGLLTDNKWISGFELIKNADLLIHDSHFTAGEYQNKIGWGHSSMEDCIKFAALAAVKKLLLTHHAPSHSDDFLKEYRKTLTNNFDHKLDFEFAKEGMVIELG